MIKIFSFEKSIGAVVWRRNGEKIEYLLLQYRSGQWDFPKGHVEDDETELMTLKRELLEETGIETYDIEEPALTMVRYFYRAKGGEFAERINEGRGVYIFKKVAYYLAQIKGEDEIRLNFENKAFVWVSFEQASKKIGNKGSKRVITMANHHLNS